MQSDFKIRSAHLDDVPIILELIRDLATYERAPNEVTATEEQLVDVLFGERPAAEVLLAFERDTPVGFAIFFHNFSTWLGRPGLYLEDLFVAGVTGAHCLSILPGLPVIAAAAEWNGQCSIGTNRRSSFIVLSVQNRWMSGPYSA